MSKSNTKEAEDKRLDEAYETSYDGKSDEVKQTADEAKSESKNTSNQKRDELPGYRFIRKLGSGAQASVYLAEREEDHKQVAVKRLNVESVKTWKEYELFRREADVLASLHIPGVAEFYDAIEMLDKDPPCSYIVQEYVPGPSLQSMINKGERFSINRVYDIILQLLDILEALHTHEPQVIHRDIKPSNIILKKLEDDSFQAYLIDFGAVANPQIQGGGSTVAGTYGYMAPEQLMGNPTPATDIYALGAVAVFLLSGVSPAEMQSKDFRLIFDSHLQNLMPAVSDTLRLMLEPDQSKRMRDYDFLRQRFRDFKVGKFDQISPYTSWDELNEKLQGVKNYCQSGNIEIWQRLPDAGNREEIPNLYQTINENTSAMDRVDVLSLGKKQKRLKLIIPVLIVLVGAVYLCIGFDTIFWIILSGAFLIIAFMIVAIYSGSHARPAISASFDKYTSIKNELLKNGRKCIATIRKIEYVQMSKEEIDSLVQYKDGGIGLSSDENWYTYKFEFDAEGKVTSCKEVKVSEVYQKGKEVGPMYYHGTPKFRITYAFNPPDDESPFDLLHTVDTHMEPDNSIKIGDPLPILYRIVKKDKKTKREYVDSMPFPVPMSDIVRLSDIIFAKDVEMRDIADPSEEKGNSEKSSKSNSEKSSKKKK